MCRYRYSFATFLVAYLLIVLPTSSETISLSPSFSDSLFASMQSTFNGAKKQTNQLGNLFNLDGVFSNMNTKSNVATTAGNNLVQGSGNQMQGYNNKLSGEDNSLIGANTTIVGNSNNAFGL